MLAEHIWVVVWGGAVAVTLCTIHICQTCFMNDKTLLQQWDDI